MEGVGDRKKLSRAWLQYPEWQAPAPLENVKCGSTRSKVGKKIFRLRGKVMRRYAKTGFERTKIPQVEQVEQASPRLQG